MKEKLYTPGPVEASPLILQAEARPLIHHRTPEFRAEMKKAGEGLQRIFQTDDPVLILCCSGSGAMEGATVNMFSPGDPVMVIRGGKFADRWINIAKAYGARVTAVEVEWGQVADPDAVRKALQANPGTKVLFGTHSETSTGARHDVKALAAVAREFDVPFVVDGITSVGAMELRTKDWGLDMVVGGSQKGFMMAPGLGFVSVSARARAIAAASRTPRFYFDFNKALKSWDAGGDTPFTPAISLVRSLVVAIELIEEEGIENVWARHAANGAATRAAMKALGLSIYPSVSSEALTTVLAPEGITSDAIIKTLLKRHGMRLANGQDSLKGRIFRIGHLGLYSAGDILAVVGALEDTLASLGHGLTSGAGLSAAQQVFAKSAHRESAAV